MGFFLFVILECQMFSSAFNRRRKQVYSSSWIIFISGAVYFCFLIQFRYGVTKKYGIYYLYYNSRETSLPMNLIQDLTASFELRNQSLLSPSV